MCLKEQRAYWYSRELLGTTCPYAALSNRYFTGKFAKNTCSSFRTNSTLRSRRKYSLVITKSKEKDRGLKVIGSVSQTELSTISLYETALFSAVSIVNTRLNRHANIHLHANRHAPVT